MDMIGAFAAEKCVAWILSKCTLVVRYEGGEISSEPEREPRFLERMFDFAKKRQQPSPAPGARLLAARKSTFFPPHAPSDFAFY
jgi:hypothetical protein